MSKDNFVLQIKASYNQFTRAEKKVADYVLDNQEKVLYMSITDLADACEVGDASVYRFCPSMLSGTIPPAVTSHRLKLEAARIMV